MTVAVPLANRACVPSNAFWTPEPVQLDGDQKKKQISRFRRVFFLPGSRAVCPVGAGVRGNPSPPPLPLLNLVELSIRAAFMGKKFKHIEC